MSSGPGVHKSGTDHQQTERQTDGYVLSSEVRGSYHNVHQSTEHIMLYQNKEAAIRTQARPEAQNLFMIGASKEGATQKFYPVVGFRDLPKIWVEPVPPPRVHGPSVGSAPPQRHHAPQQLPVPNTGSLRRTRLGNKQFDLHRLFPEHFGVLLEGCRNHNRSCLQNSHHLTKNDQNRRRKPSEMH